MSHLPIWLIGTVPTEVCDAALKEFQLLPVQDASIGDKGDKHDHHVRNTNVRFAADTHWFGGILLEHAVRANRECNWQYDMNFHENLQFAEYGEGQHYDWHCDTFPLIDAPTARKVTAVCLMNDPSEFEGGEFQIRFYQDYVAPLKKGDIIAFPSMLLHRVTPVTSGIRMSATIWMNGPRFR